MQFMHNPFNKDVDLNTILYRITYPDYFEDTDLAEEQAPDVNQVIFSSEKDLEATYTWSYGVDCWRAVYADLATAKEQVQQEIDTEGRASAETVRLRDELQQKFDLCLSVKNALQSAAEDVRQGQSVECLVLAEESLPIGSQIYFRKTSVAKWAYLKYGISILEWVEDGSTPHEQKGSASQSDHSQAGLDQSTEWESVTIQLRPANKIQFSASDGKSITRDLEGTQLLNKGTKQLRKTGLLLLKLASYGVRSIPPGQSDRERNNTSKAVSILGSCLRELSNIEGGPFQKHNRQDGWIPRFKVLDKRNAAGKRAKKDAVVVPYKDHQVTDIHGNPTAQHYDPDEYPFEDEGDDHKKDAASEFFNEPEQ